MHADDHGRSGPFASLAFHRNSTSSQIFMAANSVAVCITTTPRDSSHYSGWSTAGVQASLCCRGLRLLCSLALSLRRCLDRLSRPSAYPTTDDICLMDCTLAISTAKSSPTGPCLCCYNQIDRCSAVWEACGSYVFRNHAGLPRTLFTTPCTLEAY